MNAIIKAERMGYGSEAVGHLENGKTVFISDAVAGDVAEVEIIQEKKSFAKGRAVKIVEASPWRASCIPPDALASGAGWAALEYSAQLNAKKHNVEDALLRVGHFDNADIDAVLRDVIPCKRQWGYRNKVELAAFRENGKFSLGSHEQGSRECVSLSRCPLANRMIETSPKALTGALRYLQGKDDLGIFRVGVRASLKTKSLEVALWTKAGPFPRAFASKTLKDSLKATSIVRVISEPGSARKVKRVEVLDGCGHWVERMDTAYSRDLADEVVADRNNDASGADGTTQQDASSGYSFRVSAPSFFQVNTAQAEKLVSLALDVINPQSGMKIIDLYSGVGTFSVPLAASGAEVCAIELAGSSTRDLSVNCDRCGVDMDIVCDDAERALPKIHSADALIVDPPRSGLGSDVVSQIIRLSPATTVYVSCDPQTLARDAALLCGEGFKLECVQPVDMFPQTYHIENVAVFRSAGN